MSHPTADPEKQPGNPDKAAPPQPQEPSRPPRLSLREEHLANLRYKVEYLRDCTEAGKPPWHDDMRLARDYPGFTGYINSTPVESWTPEKKLKRWRLMQERARDKLREALAQGDGFEHMAEAGLVIYDKMRQAIEQCSKVDEVVDVRNKALALALYRKQVGDHEAEKKLAAIRIRAERRIGELLREMRESGERDAGKGGDRKSRSVETTVKPKTLSDLGVSKDQSSKFQQLAAIPQESFERAIVPTAHVPTTEGVIAAAVTVPPVPAPASEGEAKPCVRPRATPSKKQLKAWFVYASLCFIQEQWWIENYEGEVWDFAPSEFWPLLSTEVRHDVADFAKALLPWLTAIVEQAEGRAPSGKLRLKPPSAASTSSAVRPRGVAASPGTEAAVRELEGVAVESLADGKLISFGWRVEIALAGIDDEALDARASAVLRRVEREKEARGMTGTA